jgi:two-component system, OmpR family, phosphate regulon response regulator PhoB
VAHVLLLEPDRVVARYIVDELVRQNMTVSIATNADEAVKLSDKKQPDVVVSELSMPGHSGTEFLYEFRTYSDWFDIPILIFSSLRPISEITSSNDWKLLRIEKLLYKPDTSLHVLGQTVHNLIHT